MEILKNQTKIMKKNIFNTYGSILKEIQDKIMNAKCDSLSGNELCANTFKTLNESITPVIEVKAFQTKAQEIAKSDAKLKDVIDFCETKLNTSDLNFLINLVKEEHFSKLMKSGYPDPRITIKNIKDEFDQPGSVIEESIKAGIFNNLQSNLLHEIKSALDIKPDKKPLNESQSFLGSNVIKYVPIGIKFDDVKNNRVVLLTESGPLEYNKEKEEFQLYENGVEIPEAHKTLLESIITCPYNPEKETFTLNESWDFDLKLKADDTITVNNRTIPKHSVKKLLLESVKTYTQFPGTVENFNKERYLKDADKFIMLVENSRNIMKIQGLTMLKNLNENSFVLFSDTTLDGNSPDILLTSKGKKLYESYSSMVSDCNGIVGVDLNPLFESTLRKEQELFDTRNGKIVELLESQKKLNVAIEKVNSLKNLADKDSPAMKKLNEQAIELDNQLSKNITSLDHFKNNVKFY